MPSTLAPIDHAYPAARGHLLAAGRAAWWLAVPGRVGGGRLADLQAGNDAVLAAGARWSDGHLSLDGAGAKAVAGGLPLAANADMAVAMRVSIPTASQMGTFISFGTDGIGMGVGGTTLDNVGNNLIVLREGIAWDPSGQPIGVGAHTVGFTYVNTPAVAVRFFVDGRFVFEKASGPYAGFGTVTTLGGQPAGRFFGGLVGEATVWGRAIPDAAHLAFHREAVSGHPETLNRARSRAALFAPAAPPPGSSPRNRPRLAPRSFR